MKKLLPLYLFLAVFGIVHTALAQFPVYQPPVGGTPQAIMRATPGANDGAQGYATDQYLRLITAPGGINPTSPLTFSTTIDMTSATGTELDVSGYSSVVVKHTRTAQTGQLGLEFSYDGTNYQTTNCWAMNPALAVLYEFRSSCTGLNVATANFAVFGMVSVGARKLKIYPSTLGSGSLPVEVTLTMGVQPVIENMVPGVGTTNLGKAEDAVAGSGDTGVAVWQKLQAAISADAADADYGTLKGDTGGRSITTLAPAGESWQSCSASNTGTTDVAIKSAVASNRIYVTSISCFNTATVASSFQIRDGSTAMYVGGIGNSTLNGVASWSVTLPVPLRGSVNTALNFLMATNATATTCCAAGYISTI